MNVMKIIINKILSRKIDYKKCLKISVLLIAIGSIVPFLLIPKIVKEAVKQFCVFQPGHYVRDKHESGLPLLYKLYLWNVTNPNEITAGVEKPKMQEVGPYVFSQFHQKVDTYDNLTEDTFSFNAINLYKFHPHLSAPLTGNETVILLNVVLLAGIVKTKLETPHLTSTAIEGMDMIFKNASSIFITMKAIEYIDNGIPIDCNQKSFAGKAVCAELRKSEHLKTLNDNATRLRFRWFDRINNTLGARYTVSRGTKNIKDVGRIRSLNNKTMINNYKQESCNVIRGIERSIFPPLQKTKDNIWLYSDDMCKAIRLLHKNMVRYRGVITALKTIDLSDPMMKTDCDCNEYVGCYNLKGVADIYDCVKLFVIISLPHFYLAEPSLKESMEGMKPNRHSHETGVYFDWVSGAPIYATERIQLTFLVKRIPEYPILSTITDGWIPMLWYEESYTMPLQYFTLIYLTRILDVIEIMIGFILLSIGIVGCFVAALVRFHHHHVSDVSPVATVQPVLPNTVTAIIKNDVTSNDIESIYD